MLGDEIDPLFAVRTWKTNPLQKRPKFLQQVRLSRTSPSIAHNAVQSCWQIIANFSARAAATICPALTTIETSSLIVVRIESMTWRAAWGF